MATTPPGQVLTSISMLAIKCPLGAWHQVFSARHLMTEVVIDALQAIRQNQPMARPEQSPSTGRFCPICMNCHDPSIACNDPGGQMLLEAGLRRPCIMSEKDLRKRQMALRLIMAGVFLAAMGYIATCFIIVR